MSRRRSRKRSMDERNRDTKRHQEATKRRGKKRRRKRKRKKNETNGKRQEEEQKEHFLVPIISRLSQKSRKILSMGTDESEFSAFPHESAGVARKWIINDETWLMSSVFRWMTKKKLCNQKEQGLNQNESNPAPQWLCFSVCCLRNKPYQDNW